MSTQPAVRVNTLQYSLNPDFRRPGSGGQAGERPSPTRPRLSRHRFARSGEWLRGPHSRSTNTPTSADPTATSAVPNWKAPLFSGSIFLFIVGTFGISWWMLTQLALKVSASGIPQLQQIIQ